MKQQNSKRVTESGRWENLEGGTNVWLEEVNVRDGNKPAGEMESKTNNKQWREAILIEILPLRSIS